ncbi:MAG: YjbH domain-containing protein [Ignavibacteriales bacterium]|nr:YjbH domain-containing protein [Ignavibacteriales bacterium]
MSKKKLLRNSIAGFLNKKNIRLIVFIIMTTSSAAQVEYGKLSDALISEGFENVSVKTNEKTLHIAYEDRLYRSDVDGLLAIINKTIPTINLDYIEKINFVVLKSGIPIIQVISSKNILEDFINKKIDRAELVEKLQIDFDDITEENLSTAERLNSSYFKFDFVLKPTIKFEFGPYSDPVLYQINFAPHVDLTLWKGMNIRYELTIPVHNDFLPREDSIRTSLISLNQTFRFSNSFFVAASAGLFTQNRYGFDFETRNYFLNGNFSIGTNIGYTGFASFVETKLYYSDPYLWNGAVSADYRFSELDLTVGLMAGKFLQGDNTIRIDVTRDFGETTIGFFALHSTDGITNGGVNISIPLLPSKHMQPGIARIRIAENFPFTYLVKTNTPDLIGLRFNTGFRITDLLNKLNPIYLKNYIRNRSN